MNAKKFREVYCSTIKGPTNRKIINLARKLGLKDTSGNILTETGLSGKQAKEFTIKGEIL